MNQESLTLCGNLSINLDQNKAGLCGLTTCVFFNSWKVYFNIGCNVMWQIRNIVCSIWLKFNIFCRKSMLVFFISLTIQSHNHLFSSVYLRIVKSNTNRNSRDKPGYPVNFEHLVRPRITYKTHTHRHTHVMRQVRVFHILLPSIWCSSCLQFLWWFCSCCMVTLCHCRCSA